MAEQGSKAGRRDRHVKLAAEQKARKRLRRARAEVHEALAEAARMKRSKKKGCANRT
jgi:hypothetical protein